MIDREAEQVLDLADENDDGNARVNPTVTGKGMYLMKVPSRSKPIAAMMMPESNVARIRPSMPCCATVADTSTMKAPAGPPI